MKSKIIISSIILLILIGGTFLTFQSEGEENKLDSKNRPNEYFYFQRSYPENKMDYKGFNQALKHASAQMQNNKSGDGINGDWTIEGPTNIGGRLNAIEIDPNNSNIIYTGSAAGGIFKTIDGGTTWNLLNGGLTLPNSSIDPLNESALFFSDIWIFRLIFLCKLQNF